MLSWPRYAGLTGPFSVVRASLGLIFFVVADLVPILSFLGVSLYRVDWVGVGYPTRLDG